MTDNNRPPRKPVRPAGARTSDRRQAAEAPRRGGAVPPEARDDARIAKIMARAGLCSRRDAETWIAARRVAVNGTVIDSPALNVKPGDRITVDGMPLPEREQTRLFLFHKPRGVVTTARDPEGRQTIFDVLPEELPRLVTVGRLDINTEGLMLLTNDGGLARVLELPSTGWLRRYRVRANGEITQPQLDVLAAGVTIEGVDYAGIEARLDRIQGANAWLTMGLREGKNREIKRVLEHLGLAVTRLIRVSYGPFQLGEQPVGTVIEIRPRVLRDQLGETLAREAGIDLDERPQTEVRREARGRALPVPEPLRPGSPEPKARPHVSALRSARQDTATEGRRRTERSATADRKGRAVKVERVSSTVPKAAEPDSRNARRFVRDKQADADERPRPGRPARNGIYDAPRRNPEGQPGGRFGERDAAADRSRPYDAPRREARPSRDEHHRREADRVPVRSQNPRAWSLRKPEGESAGGRETTARPARGFGARERPSGGMAFKPRRDGAKSQGAKPQGDRSQGDRMPDAEAGARSDMARPRTPRRPEAGVAGQRDAVAKPSRSFGAKARPTGGFAGKPRRGGPSGDRPQRGGDRPRGKPRG